MSEFLKCDAVGCDHVEDVAEITAEMVGKECPKCGANLLTDADWQFYATVFRPNVQTMEKLGLLKRADSTDSDPDVVRFHYHDGEARISMPNKTA